MTVRPHAALLGLGALCILVSSCAPGGADAPTGVVRHAVLRRWNPLHKSRQGPVTFTNDLGLDVLLEQEVEESQLVRFVDHLGRAGEYAIVRIYTSRECWSDDTNLSEPCKSGFVLIYLKNPRAGLNEIHWTQEDGKFSALFGKITALQ